MSFLGASFPFNKYLKNQSIVDQSLTERWESSRRSQPSRHVTKNNNTWQKHAFFTSRGTKNSKERQTRGKKKRKNNQVKEWRCSGDLEKKWSKLYVVRYASRDSIYSIRGKIITGDKRRLRKRVRRLVHLPLTYTDSSLPVFFIQTRYLPNTSTRHLGDVFTQIRFLRVFELALSAASSFRKVLGNTRYELLHDETNSMAICFGEFFHFYDRLNKSVDIF